MPLRLSEGSGLGPESSLLLLPYATEKHSGFTKKKKNCAPSLRTENPAINRKSYLRGEGIFADLTPRGSETCKLYPKKRKIAKSFPFAIYIKIYQKDIDLLTCEKNLAKKGVV